MSSTLTHPDSHPRLVRLAEDTRAYIAQSRSPRTKAVYTRQWRAFVGWCAVHGEAPLPARPEALALYLTDCAKRGLRPATLTQALAAICEAHKLASVEAPRHHPLVRETLRGIKRAAGSAQHGRAPLLPDAFRRILHVIPTDTTIGMRDRALLMFGYLGGFRRSELVRIERAHLREEPAGIVVTLHGSKDDVALVGREVPVLRASIARYCPVIALEAWLGRAKVERGPVFRAVHRNGDVYGPLRGEDVAKIVKRRAREAGLDTRTISGHSLRSGFVTAAHLKGATLEAIMKVTGHKSYDTAMRYIRKADLFAQHPAEDLL